MDDSFFSTIPPHIRHQLKLCGITTDTQLAVGVASLIQQDLQNARLFFPEEDISLTEAELEKLIHKAKEISGLPEIQQEPLLPVKPLPQFAKDVTIVEEEAIPSTAEQDEAEQAAETEAFLGQIKTTHSHKGNRRPITCGHPFLLLFGAFATLLVPFFILSLIGLPYLLLLSDYRPLGEDEIIYIVVAFMLIIPHLAMVHLVHCSVCHMNLFTFRNYPYHSKAHNVPLLGVPLSTALKIIFFLRYTCPACGTEQKLFGKRSHQRHSHRS